MPVKIADLFHIFHRFPWFHHGFPRFSLTHSIENMLKLLPPRAAVAVWAPNMPSGGSQLLSQATRPLRTVWNKGPILEDLEAKRNWQIAIRSIRLNYSVRLLVETEDLKIHENFIKYPVHPKLHPCMVLALGERQSLILVPTQLARAALLTA